MNGLKVNTCVPQEFLAVSTTTTTITTTTSSSFTANATTTSITTSSSTTTIIIIIIIIIINCLPPSQSAITLSARPQQGDLRLLGPPSGQSAGSGHWRWRRRRWWWLTMQGTLEGHRCLLSRVPADLRAVSLATVPPTPLMIYGDNDKIGADLS
ncbi:antigen b membrane protein [Plakobranchus ocellatus]|uniref:Antigen b membrane protein n=1 Tax=Plakobranchus ocellatus TaxID=259542 RepID=A0AAV4AMR8_9GAST|nr:antigen b membrane protein [Plakobranchus ocellatus]